MTTPIQIEQSIEMDLQPKEILDLPWISKIAITKRLIEEEYIHINCFDIFDGIEYLPQTKEENGIAETNENLTETLYEKYEIVLTDLQTPADLARTAFNEASVIGHIFNNAMREIRDRVQPVRKLSTMCISRIPSAHEKQAFQMMATGEI